MSGYSLHWDTKEELLAYARELEGKTINIVNAEHAEQSLLLKENQPDFPAKEYKGKGQFGEYIEENYFGKENDSISKPDFDEVGVELKVVPLKKLQSGELRVKERLVLNTFRYIDIVKEKFESSHFLEKDSLLLLIFYLHNNALALGDKEIDLVDYWEVLKHDFNQIKADWEYIVDKIKAGKAHELTEGDTLYLGACTKGSTADKSMQTQPFSNVKARGRALCFKISYINFIYKLLSEERNKRRKAIKESSIYNTDAKWIPLEQRIHQLVDKFKGMDGREIYSYLSIPYNPKNKSRYALIARSMLGFSSKNKNYYEFEAANIQVKAIRVEKNGIVKQSMSFRNIPFTEIISQDWEDSYFYEELTSKFIFMVFKESQDNNDFYFSDVYLWNMPSDDIEVAHAVWEEAKQKVIDGDYEHMPAMGNNDIAHVRPKGSDSKDLTPTPQGFLEKKKCFWLKNTYIKSVIEELERHDSN